MSFGSNKRVILRLCVCLGSLAISTSIQGKEPCIFVYDEAQGVGSRNETSNPFYSLPIILPEDWAERGLKVKKVELRFKNRGSGNQAGRIVDDYATINGKTFAESVADASMGYDLTSLWKHSITNRIEAYSTDDPEEYLSPFLLTITSDGCEKCEEGDCPDGGGGGGGGSGKNGGSGSPNGNPNQNDFAGFKWPIDGSLKIFMNGGPSTNYSKPQGLTLNAGSKVDRILDANSAIKQVIAPAVSIDVKITNDFKYVLDFYSPTQTSATTNSSGVYTFTGSPFVNWIVENPSGSTNDLDTVNVIEQRDGSSKTNQFYWATTNNLQYTPYGSLRKESLASSWSGTTNRTDSFQVKNLDDTLVYEERNTFGIFSWGERITRKEIGPTNNPVVTTWSYYENVGDGNNYKRIKEVVHPTGSWERYSDYDVLFRPGKVVSQFKDQALGGAEADNRVVTTTYGTSAPDITVVEKLKGQEISRRFTVYGDGETKEIQAHSAGAAWDNATNLVTTIKMYTNGSFISETESVKNPDGTLSLYTYSTNSTIKTTTVFTGEPGDAACTNVIAGTKSITLTSIAHGTTMAQTNYFLPGELLMSASATTSTNGFGQATRIEYQDGTVETFTYDCCGLTGQTDREGISTTYVNDAQHRNISATRAGITTLTDYDAESRVTKITRKGSDNSEIITSQAVFDTAGRQTSSKDALLNETTFSETSSGTVKTTTFPNGKTRIETYHKDGRLQNIRGTGVHHMDYEYDVDATDGYFVKELKTGTSEWTKTFTDFLGRTHKATTAAGATSTWSYNSKGQLVKTVDPDGVATLFRYNGEGELEYTAIDMDRDGVIDFEGTDRITKTVNEVVNSGGLKSRSTTSEYSTGGTNLTTTASINETSITNSMQSWSINFGLTNHFKTVFNGGGTNDTISTAPDGVVTTNSFRNGLLVSSISAHSSVGPLRTSTFTYDAHNRQSTITDGRASTVRTLGYNKNDQVITNTVGSQTTVFVFDSMGRNSSTTLPDGGIVTNTFADTGELKKTSGTRTYPVEYGYDVQGRLETMKTWQDHVGNSGTAITTWRYGSTTGFLTSKEYQGGTNAINYTYTAAGRLGTRVWARGVTTTYSNDNGGQLFSIDYSDSTPDVTYSFDRRGRKTSVTHGTNVVNYAFHDSGALVSESYAGGILDGLVVSNSFDSLIRRDALVATKGSQLVSHGFSYDGASRLSTVTDNTTTNSATYTYFTNSSLVSSMVFKRNGTDVMTTSKTYDSLDRLTSISSRAATTNSFDYTYNSANQRTRSTLADGSYWDYTYDSLGQVTNGVKRLADGTAVNGQSFGYLFDDIGNRKHAVINGQASTNTINLLNQYTERNVPPAFDILGTAKSGATVTVNNQQTSRQGEYFYKQVSVTNASAAVYQSISVVGVSNNATTNNFDAVTTETGNAFVAKTPETFMFDLDGNLTSDGRWAYTWDAENRMTSVEAISAAPSGAKAKVEYTHDYQWRIIQRKEYSWSGSSYTLSETRRFAYDGMRMIAQLDGSGNLLHSYTWGTDLSGTIDGAGGVGGVLMVHDVATNPDHYPIYNGNGDIMAFVNAATGEISLEREYGPFGELIRETGTMANSSPFAFSTKYGDPTTGYIWFRYRCYDPSTGRWLSRDPIGEKGGLHLYGFVDNNGVNKVDVHGLRGVDDFVNHYYLGKGRDFDLIARGYEGILENALHEDAVKALKEKLSTIARKTHASKLKVVTVERESGDARVVTHPDLQSVIFSVGDTTLISNVQGFLHIICPPGSTQGDFYGKYTFNGMRHHSIDDKFQDPLGIDNMTLGIWPGTGELPMGQRYNIKGNWGRVFQTHGEFSN